MLSFLKKKFKGYSLIEILYTQIEPALFWFFKGLPTYFGLFGRYLVCKLLFKHLTGFAWIQANVEIVNAHRICCGQNLGVNCGTYINAIGGIEIGNNVLIGSNVTISSGLHPIDNIAGDIFEIPTIPKKISIASGVWIGAGAVIMPGVDLGQGCVIGANSVVTKSTEPYSVNVGVPSRKVRSRVLTS